MATDEQSGTMPEPDITTRLSTGEICTILADEARRDAIELIAMRGWVAVDGLDADAVAALAEWDVLDVRGEGAERGQNFAGVLRALNAIAREQRDLR